MWDALWINANLATMAAGGPSYGAIRDGAFGIEGGRIAWIGPQSDLPGAPETLARVVHDAGGRWVTPGLIDCHTHLVFAGDRAGEFEQRLLGATYEEISRAGGGIVSTVRAVREASVDELVAQSVPRLAALKAEGVTTVEIKSGYGLDTENELKMLEAARRVGEGCGIRVSRTFLGAHALPPEYEGRADDYISLVCDEMIPAVAEAGAADAVDAFCETIGISPALVERVFAAAAEHGLRVKLHAEQLSDLSGAALAARHKALSADHLEHLSEDGIAALAASGTVAVLLPAAFYFLRDTKVPPVDALRAARVPMAVATDCNPGSSPCASLLLAMNMACTLFRLSPEEALAGATRNAAQALGLEEDIGTLEVGKAADFAVWSVREPAELAYWIGGLRPDAVFVAGG